MTESREAGGLWAFRLVPSGDRSWRDLAPPGNAGIQGLYALLDEGLVEAWQDEAGSIRFSLAAPCGDGWMRPPRPRRAV